MTNKPDALPVAVVKEAPYSDAGGDGYHYEISERLPIGTKLYAAQLPAPSQVAAECNCPKIGERFNPAKSSGACPVHDLKSTSQVAAEVVQVPRDLADELLAELSPKNPVSKALRALLATSQGEA